MAQANAKAKARKEQSGSKGKPAEAAAPELPPEVWNRGATAFTLGLIVPGLGHAYLGKTGRALLMLLGVVSLATLGLLHHGGLASPRPGEPLSYLATFGNLGIGPAYFVLRRFGFAAALPDDPTFEYGSTYMLSAGLINFLVMLDAFDIAVGRKK